MLWPVGFENGHLARVSLVATRPGNEVVNTLHYSLESSFGETAANMQSLADRLADDLLGPYKALFTTEWTIQPVTVMDEIDPQNPTASRQGKTAGSPGPGTITPPGSASQAPLEECVVATVLTGLVGRRFRGRMFLPPIFTEDDTFDGILAASGVTKYEAFLSQIPLEPDIVTGGGTGTANWVVYSRTQRAADLDPYAPHVTGYLLRRQLRWLRSRGR